MIVALAGTPAIVKAVLVPAATPSGTTRLSVGEATVTEPGTGGGAEAVLSCVPLIPATPPQENCGVIVTFGKGLTDNTAQAEILLPLTGAHVPANTTR